MPIKKIFLPTYIILLIVIPFSCSNSEQKYNPNNHIESEQKGATKYQIRLKLLPGEKYYYTILNETKTKVEIQDQNKETGTSYELGLIYNVSIDSSGNTTLEVKYDKIRIIVKNKGEDDEIIDADNASGAFDSVDKILSSIKGESLIITLDKSGNILKVDGTKEITSKVLANMVSNDLAAKDKVRELLSQLVGDGFIKNNIEQNFKVFPDTAIYVGDSWEKKGEEMSSINFETRARYVLITIKDGQAIIKVDGTFSNNKEQKLNILEKDVIASLKGTQKGEIKVDEKNGMLIGTKIRTEVEGDIEVLGKVVPITISVNRKVSVRKM